MPGTVLGHGEQNRQNVLPLRRNKKEQINKKIETGGKSHGGREQRGGIGVQGGSGDCKFQE